MSSAPAQAKLLTVGAIFAEQGTSYVIPIYQRNYSWRQEQIEQLVDDVWAAARDPHQNHYFLGNLVVARAASGSERPGEWQLEVIDGQQRLTTLSLLRAALDEDDWLPGDRLHYASRPKATAALATLRRSEDEDGTGIHTAYKVVQQVVEAKLSPGEERKQFADFLRDSVQLVRAVLVPDFDLNHYFEIMNTRGQQLQQVDIVKARLLSHLADDPGAQVSFSWIWDACAAMDRYVQLTATPARPDLRQRIFGEQWDRLEIADFAQLQALCPEATTEPDAIETGASDARGLRAALDAYAAAAPREAAGEDEATRFRSPIEFPSLLLHVLKVLDESDAGGEDDEGGLDDNKLIRIFAAWLERDRDAGPGCRSGASPSSCSAAASCSTTACSSESSPPRTATTAPGRSSAWPAAGPRSRTSPTRRLSGTATTSRRRTCAPEASCCCSRCCGSPTRPPARCTGSPGSCA